MPVQISFSDSAMFNLNPREHHSLNANKTLNITEDVLKYLLLSAHISFILSRFPHIFFNHHIRGEIHPNENSFTIYHHVIPNLSFFCRTQKRLATKLTSIVWSQNQRQVSFVFHRKKINMRVDIMRVNKYLQNCIFEWIIYSQLVSKGRCCLNVKLSQL